MVDGFQELVIQCLILASFIALYFAYDSGKRWLKDIGFLPK